MQVLRRILRAQRREWHQTLSHKCATRARLAELLGKTRQARVPALGSAGFPGATTAPQAAAIPRRKGRALMTNPEVELRRSARIAARRKIKATRKPRAPARDANVSSEGEGGSRPDIRKAILEAERDRVSDVSLRAVGGVPEGARAQRKKVERSRRRAKSPVTSGVKRGREQSSTSRDSTPSPVPAHSAPIPEVQSPLGPERQSHMQPRLLAQSKVVQTRSKQKASDFL